VIINCLDSYDYLHAIYQLQHGETLTHTDRFLLFRCWDFVPFKSFPLSEKSDEKPTLNLVQEVYDQLLTRLEQTLAVTAPVAPPSFAYIFERIQQLLSIRQLNSFDRHAVRIVDHLVTILQQVHDTDQDRAIKLVSLNAIDSLARHSDIRLVMMQKQQLANLVQTYTSDVHDADTRRLAFAVLAQIINEDMAGSNARGMMAVFVEQLKQAEKPAHNADTARTLDSVRGRSMPMRSNTTMNVHVVALMEHEEMKDAFISEDGVPTLMAFVRDSESDDHGDGEHQSTEQLIDAIKILWSCSFSRPDIRTAIRQDAALMARLHRLEEQPTDKSNDQADTRLQKAAEGLLWKVEKEEQKAAELEQKRQEKRRQAHESRSAAGEQVGNDDDDDEDEEKYDLMISYAWADMDLAHRIFHHLRDRLGYKIWIDQEQMHGSTIEAMVSASCSITLLDTSARPFVDYVSCLCR
jgi:hypothetical protein